MLKRIVTRAEAERRGLKQYFTGKPCKNGHVGERYAASGNCVECGRESFKRWNARDRLRRVPREPEIDEAPFG